MSESSNLGTVSDRTPSSPESTGSFDEWSSDNSSRKRAAHSEGPGPRTKKREIEEDTSKEPFHLRFLIKSQFCSRVLGHGARRLQELKEKASKRHAPMEAWISRPMNTEYRVMHAVGSPETVSKFVGLVTRVILDEPDEPSNAQSRIFTLLVLMPHAVMGRLIGTKMSHFKEIERQSAAHLSADHAKLPNSDDRLIYITGVVDSLHIAIFHLATAYLRDNPTRKHNFTPFEPAEGVSFGIREIHNPRGMRKPSMAELKSKASHENIGPDSRENGKESSEDRGTPSRPRSRGLAPTSGTPPAIALPSMSGKVSQAILTAYDVARGSSKEQLRQCVHVPNNESEEVTVLVDNIQRVTKTRVEKVDEDSLALSGAPEENALALYLIYRHLRQSP